MKQNLEIPFETFQNIDELSDIERQLFTAASEIREKAYAPYSDFWVGCAILLDDGQIIQGNNQENAAYPSGLCAERTALYWLSANFPDKKIKKIFIVGGAHHNPSPSPIPPCGSCRQSILEYETKQNHNIELYFSSVQGQVVKCYSIKNLLPFSFDKNHL
ncbi:cytidine deaminase [Elizabethkingia sp. JS20170427COW]|uniref:cytidine deaminase n=1 Tax=Elizabethkingia sp. JS20170427COW TaxID=2583851 RepID=UPI00111092A3|nr:cytidine deaminase [Elizabethkingia sp. JS20170427COW]QCX53836.1 cytidine deaminase [Elizabethkingia sp. JS20170427COW]